MLIPAQMQETAFRRPMGLGATMMFGWTALLVWGYRKPLERKGVVLLTVVPVLVGITATQIWAVLADQLSFQRALPTLIVAVGLILLMSFSYWNARGVVPGTASHPTTG